MDAQRRKAFRIKFSGFHLLILVYCLALAGTLSWLNIEKQSEASQIHINSVENIKSHVDVTSLVFTGEGFHKALRGYYAERAQVSKEPLWNILSGTSVRAIDVKDGLALAACFKNKLVSIDVTDEDRPIILDSLEMPESITAVKILDDKVVVGMARGAGIAIVDLYHPQKLQLSRRIPMDSAVYSLVSVGSQVLFTDYSRGVGLLDLNSDSLSPKIIVNIERPWGLASNGQYVAISSLLNVIELFEVSLEGRLNPKAKIRFPDLDRGGLRGIAFVNDYLLVAQDDRQLKTFSVEKGRAYEISSLGLPGVPYAVLPSSENVFVSLVGGGIAKVDVLAEGKCVVASHQAMPTTAISMAADDETLYFSGVGNHKGLSAFPVNVYQDLLPRSLDYIDFQYQSFFRWNDKLYGYRRDKTLVKLSTGSEPGQQKAGNIVLVVDKDGVGVFKSFPALDGKEGLAQQGSLVHPNRIMAAISGEESLYLLHRKGLDVFVGARLDSMSRVAEFEIKGQAATMATLSDDHLLVATQRAGILVIDLSEKDAPSIVSTLLPPSHLQSNTIARDIVFFDSIAYVSQGSGGVYVIDVSRLDDIKLLRIIDTPGVAKEMDVKGDLLVVADGDMGVFLIDIANTREPVPIGNLPAPLAVQSIAFSEQGLLVSDHPGGTIKLPLPTKLKSIALVDDKKLRAAFGKVDRPGYAYLYDDFNRSRVRLKAN